MDTRQTHFQVAQEGQSGVIVNQVLRNTYALLSMTLIFSALAAGYAMMTNMAPFSPLVVIGVYFGTLFATHKLRNSAWGIAAVFALTGWLGLTLGPILNYYVTAISNGSELIMLSLGGTGLIFFTMSGIALVTRKNFNFMTNFLMVGILVAFIAAIASMFLDIPGLSLTVSAAFLLISSGLILWQTSQIIHGGETNYISATVMLYVMLYNVFTSLLHLLSAFSGND